MIYISFDFDTKELEKYYDKTPNNAYNVVKKFLNDSGFVSYKDTNYISNLATEFDATQLLTEFAEENKWFPHCLTKLHIMEIVKDWDYLLEFKENSDFDFKQQIDDKMLNSTKKVESITDRITRIKNETDLKSTVIDTEKQIFNKKER